MDYELLVAECVRTPRAKGVTLADVCWLAFRAQTGFAPNEQQWAEIEKLVRKAPQTWFHQPKARPWKG